MNKNRELEYHKVALEKRVERMQENQAMFKVMMDDLENYK